MHQKYNAFFYLFKKYNLTSLCLDFFCAAKAHRARSFVGQRFSYMLRGHAVIAKTWVPENTNRKQKPKPQTKQKDPAKEVPRKLGEKVKLTRPKPLRAKQLLPPTTHKVSLHSSSRLRPCSISYHWALTSQGKISYCCACMGSSRTSASTLRLYTPCLVCHTCATLCSCWWIHFHEFASA